MKTLRDCLAAVREASAELEQPGRPPFDAAADMFQLLSAAVSAVALQYNRDTLEAWIKAENPVFDRYASKLKIALEAQRDYLASVSDLFQVDEAAVFQKIRDCEQGIRDLLAQDQSLLNQGAELAVREKELQQQRLELEGLRRKQQELNELEQTLSAVNVAALSAEVQELSASHERLSADRQPLLEQKQRLTAECDNLRESMSQLEQDIRKLTSGQAEESAAAADRISQWRVAIGQRLLERERKAEQYAAELAAEARQLQALETQIREQLRRLAEYEEKNSELRDILESHFQADKSLSLRFQRSLAGMEQESDGLSTTIQHQLNAFDALLKRMHQKIEETEQQIKPIRIGE